MAGGRFDKSVGKVRPGTYTNFESSRQETTSASERGTVILPLMNADYGPAGEFLTIYNSSPDAQKAKLGYSIFDNDKNGNMLLIREAMKGASTIIAYICNENLAAATGTGGGLNATAKYKGERGNALEYSVVENPMEGFDVSVFLEDTKVEFYENITKAEELAESEYITFSQKDGEEISAIAGVKLQGGTNESTKNGDITAFLDKSENIPWNTMAFPVEDNELHTALKTKIKHMREDMGKGVQAVAPDFKADYEGIINLTNSYAINDRKLTTAQATAYVAGITAGASDIESNTYRPIDGATQIIGEKTHEEAVAAIKAGEFFFSVSEEGKIVVEYDINSLTTFAKPKDKTYAKNRVIRVFDTFQELIQVNFPPNKFDNNSDGWDIMEGIGRSLLKKKGPRSDGGTGALKNVNYQADFKVDRGASSGDETFFNVGLEPVDSAEKLYFTIRTR